MAKYTQRASLRRAPGDPLQPSHFAHLVALLLLVASLGGPWPPSALAADSSAYGVAVTPQNFPDFTAGDVDEAFALAKQIGDYAVFIYQWGKLVSVGKTGPSSSTLDGREVAPLVCCPSSA